MKDTLRDDLDRLLAEWNERCPDTAQTGQLRFVLIVDDARRIPPDTALQRTPEPPSREMGRRAIFIEGAQWALGLDYAPVGVDEVEAEAARRYGGET